MQLPRKKTYNIAEASELLGVSTKTLRRWDAAGKLSPKRSEGGHRRYLLKDLEKFLQLHNLKQQIAETKTEPQPLADEVINTPNEKVFVPHVAHVSQHAIQQINNDSIPHTVEFVEYPNLYDQMPLANKKLISRYAKVFTAILAVVVAGKVALTPARMALHSLAVNYLPYEYSQKLAFLAPDQKLSKVNKGGPSVLAATALENPTFGINVDTVFRAAVNFVQGITTPTIEVTDTATINTADITGDATVGGNLDLTGDLNITGDIASTSDTVNLFNSTVTTINMGSDATTISIGSTGSTSTINGNLIVTGTSDLQGAVTAGDTLEVDGATTLSSTLSVSGDSTLSGAITGGSSLTLAGLLDVNGTGTNDIAGTLNLSGNTLTSSADLLINPTGGGVSIGTGTPGDIDMADGDLYITNDLEVDGVIYGTFSGSVSTGFTQGSVVFIDAAGGLDEDNTNFFWDDTLNKLGISNTNPQYAVDITGTLHATGGTTLSNTLNVSGATTLSNTLDVTLAGRFLSTLEVTDNIDFNGTGTNDIAGTLNLSGNTLSSTGDLIITAGGGGTKIGNGTPVSANMAGDDLYVTGDFEVGGTIYGGLSGTVTTSFSQGSIVFINGGGNLAEDNSNFFWDDTNNRLSLGTNSGATTTLYVSGTSLVTGNSTFNGGVTLGDATSDTLTLTSRIAGNLVPTTASTYDLGDATRTWETLYVDNIVAANISTSATDLNGTSAAAFTINNDNATADTESSSLVFDRGTPSVNAIIGWNSTTPSPSTLGKFIYVNSPTFAINPTGETGITYSGKAALLVNQVQNQDLITASASGSTRFKVDVNGEITASGIGKMIIVDGVKYARTCAGINAAIDALGSDGGEVYLPEATYTCTESIVIDYNNTTIRGSGKGTKITPSAWASWITPGHIINTNGKDYLTFRDFQIDGTSIKGGGQSYSLIYAGVSTTNSTFDSLYLYKSDASGIATSGTGNNTFTNNIFESNDLYGIDNESTGNRIIGNSFTSNEIGVYIAEISWGLSTVNSNYFESNNYGIYGQHCGDSIINGNMVNQSTTAGIYIGGGNHWQVIISNNAIHNYSYAPVSTYGIYFAHSGTSMAGSAVIGNSVIEHDKVGAVAITVASSDYVNVADNSFYSNTTNLSITGTNISTTQSYGSYTSIGGGDSTPDTTLEVYRESGSNSTLSMTDGDVSHGFTTAFSNQYASLTDSFFDVSPISSTAGGAMITGISDTGTTEGVNIRGLLNSSDPTDSIAAVRILGYKLSGTTVQDLGAAETVFAIANNDDANAVTVFGDGSSSFRSAATSGTANLMTMDSVTTGNGLSLSADGLTTGNGMYLESTSTAFSSGNIASMYWNPGSATTATGDLLRLNVGSNGILGNIFNVMNNSSSVFSVSQSQITSALPHQFTAAGDVSIAYDLQFTNQTASYIKSLAPLYIEAGESFENNDLTLRTYGTGNVTMDLSGTGKLQLVGTDTSMVLDTKTATDTDFWLGVQDDAGADDDDTFQIGDGTTPGTNPWLVLDTSGKLGIGTDTTPDYQLEVNAAASSDPSFALTDGDITHGLTTLANTDAILLMTALSSSNGGTQITAISETDAQALSIRGVIGSTNPTDTTAAVKIIGGKASGTTIGDLGAAEAVFSVANNDDADALTIQGNGDVGIGEDTPYRKLSVTSSDDEALMIKRESTANLQTTGMLFSVADSGQTDPNYTKGALYYQRDDAGGGYGKGNLIFALDNSNDATVVTSADAIMTLKYTGDVGIGETAPDGKLEIAGTDAANNELLVLDTEESTATQDVWILQSDTTGNGQSVDTTKATFNADGSLQISLTGTQTTNGLCHTGSAQDNNDEIVDCSGAPSDYAEWYPVDSSVTAGDVVSVSSTSFEYDAEGSDPFTGRITSLGKDTISVLNKATDSGHVIGIVSTGPYSTIGEDVKKSIERSGNNAIKPAPIALSGRVPVKVSPTSADLEVGDLVAVSTTDAGRVIKATGSGYTVGRVLQSWTKASGKQTVLVFVANNYFAGMDITLDANGNVLSATDMNNLEAANQTSSYIDALTFSTEIESIDGRLTSLETKTTTLEDKLNQVMNELEIVKGQTALATASAAVNFDSPLSTQSAQLTTIDGVTTLGDTVITGKLDIGLLNFDSTNSSIDAIGDLNIQKLALGNVKFFDGLIEFDKAGNIKVKEVQAEKFTALGQSAGKSTLPTGEKEIFINTTSVTDDSLIMITPTSTTPYPLTVTQKVTGEGFKVEMSIWASEDVAFDWFIVDHKEIN